jgi:nuclear pore complex protein Nup205
VRVFITVTDQFIVHYLPAISGYITHSLVGTTPIADARALNEKVLRQPDQKSWTLTYVHAAIRAWWLAEYSDYFSENHEATLTPNQLEEGWLISLEDLFLVANFGLRK